MRQQQLASRAKTNLQKNREHAEGHDEATAAADTERNEATAAADTERNEATAGVAQNKLDTEDILRSQSIKKCSSEDEDVESWPSSMIQEQSSKMTK